VTQPVIIINVDRDNFSKSILSLYLSATTLTMFNKEEAFQKISELTERFAELIAT
jgi:hypothetical protein